MASNSVGNELHRLKQRRQPWQMSNTRSSSLVSSSSSQKSGFCQSIGWRVGASRPPSRRWSPPLDMLAYPLDLNILPTSGGAESAPVAGIISSVLLLLAQGVQGFLEAVGVGTLRLRQGLEPVGDLAETFLAGGLGH